MQLWSKLEINIYLFILIVAMIRYTFQLAVMISFTHVVLNLTSLQLVFSRFHSNLDPEPHFDLVLILSYMYCGQKYQKQQKCIISLRFSCCQYQYYCVIQNYLITRECHILEVSHLILILTPSYVVYIDIHHLYFLLTMICCIFSTQIEILGNHLQNSTVN